MIFAILFCATLFLAFSNGANDNFKGFATTWGSGSLSYRAALILSNLATLLGGVASILIADNLIQQFSGKGLVSDDLAQSGPFALAVSGGAGFTVMLATRLGFPISTTHALVGGLIGAGLASGEGIAIEKLGSSFILPLLTSPFISAFLAMSAFFLVSRFRKPKIKIVTKPILDDDKADDKTVKTVTVEDENTTLKAIHIMSAFTICFARAVNDAPKLAALLLGASIFGGSNSSSYNLLIVTAAMVLGGWLLSRRVAETMSLKVSKIGSLQGVSANLVTTAIVLMASKFSLPVSTTHVSVGSIIGSGAAAKTLDLSTVRNVILSWVVTLPVAIVGAAIFYTVIAAF